MNILDEMQKIEQESKAIDNIGNFTSSYYNKIAPITKQTDYLSTSTGWVYACVNVIADELAKIKLRLYKSKGDSVEEVFEHPILDLLNRANPFTTQYDLFFLTANYLELTGEAPWYIIKQNGIPTDIFLLRPDKLSIKAGSQDFVEGYVYRNDQGKDIPLDKDEVIFIKYPDPTNYFRGLGTLQAAARVYDIEQFSENYNKNFFYNGASAGIVFKTEQKLNKDVRERFKKQIDQNHKGVDNSHKYLLLEAGLDAKPLQLSQKDMEFFNQLQWTRDKILGIFRVPRTALGITDDVNRANAEATDYVFAKRTIKPKMTKLIQQLNEFLLPMFPDGENYIIDFEDPVPEDVDSKLKYYESGLKNGFMTINEVRDREGLEGVGAVGDIVRFNGQDLTDTPAEGDKIFSKKSKELSQKISLRNKTSLKKENMKKVDNIIKQSIKAIKGDIKNMVVKEEVRRDKAVMKWSEKKKEENWNLIIKRATRNEMRLRNSVSKQFMAQAERILTKNNQKALKVGDWKLDIDNEKQIWFRILLPIITDIVVEEGQSVMSSIARGLTFDAFDETVRNFIENRTAKISKSINETTNRKIRKLLKNNFKENEEVIGRKIRKLFGDFSVDRSKLIARTETFKAINFSTEEAYSQSGVVEYKEWFTALDERVCPFCQPLHGKKFALGETIYKQGETVIGSDGSRLELSYESVQNPPLHANCRCGLVPVLVGQKDYNEIIKNKIEYQHAKANIKEMQDRAKLVEEIHEVRSKLDNTDKKIDKIKDDNKKEISKIADNVNKVLEDE